MLKRRKFLISTIFLIFMGMNCLLASSENSQASHLLKQANDHLSLHQFKPAIKILQNAAQIDPSNWEIHYKLGLSFYRLRRYSEAITSYDKALELNPEETDVQKALGAIYVLKAKESHKKGNISEQSEYMLKACKAYPGGTKIWLSLFKSWREAGQNNIIKQEGDFLLSKHRSKLNGSYDEALQQCLVIIALTYFKENNISKSEEFANAADSIRVHNDELYYLKRDIKTHHNEAIKELVDQAEKYYSRDEYQSGIDLYKKILDMPGDKPSDIYERIEIFENDKKHSNACKEILSLIDQKQYDKASERLTKALDDFPEDSRLTEIKQKLGLIQDEERRKTSIALEAKLKKEEHQRIIQTRYNRFLEESKEAEADFRYRDAISELEKALKLPVSDKAKLNARISFLKKTSEEFNLQETKYREQKETLQKYFSESKYSEAFELSSSMLQEFDRYKEDILPIAAESALYSEHLAEAENYGSQIASESEPLFYYIKAVIAYKSSNFTDALTYFDKSTEANDNVKFRSDVLMLTISSLIQKWLIYIISAIVVLLLLLIKPMLTKLKEYSKSRLTSKIERIKNKGDYEKHIDFLEDHYLKEDIPDMKTVSLLLAAALLKTGNPQRAYEISNTLLKRDSRNPLLKKIAGEAAMQLGDTSTKAIEHIQNLYKLDESRSDIIDYLAHAYIETGADHKTAMDFIERALIKNPSDSVLFLYLADCHIKRSIYNNQTLRLFDKAIKAVPTEKKYYDAMIENYKILGDKEKMEEWKKYVKENFGSSGYSSFNSSSFDDGNESYARYNSVDQEEQSKMFFGGMNDSSVGDIGNVGAAGAVEANTYGTDQSIQSMVQPLSETDVSRIDFTNTSNGSFTGDQSASPYQEDLSVVKPIDNIPQTPGNIPDYNSIGNDPTNDISSLGLPAFGDPSLLNPGDIFPGGVDNNQGNEQQPVASIPNSLPDLGSFSNMFSNKPQSNNINLSNIPPLPDILGSINENPSSAAPTASEFDSNQTLAGFNMPDISKIPASEPKPNPAVSGPQRPCPSCGAANSITEYYCCKCGKPLL